MTAQATTAPAVGDPLLRVLDLLDGLGVRYMVGGSIASSIHGTPRATMDADVVVELDSRCVPALVAGLEGEYYVSEPMIREALAHRSSFNVIHLATGLKVDLFVLPEREWDHLALSRRVPVPYPGAPGRSVFVRTAEDIVLKKLEWFRLGGGVSERQWRDVLGVLRMQADRLDLPYLHRWAPSLGVEDLLASCLREADASRPAR